ncbi:hypothetical protein [Limnoglobus roseus]|uniref:Uncharacterized protein n=1 Tax=Limnoglobus roseus TaxID=2598579 RepID=A0A5C1ADX0_9BACT|nr:hypothetical protein [Limnoglobus roseus]QEL16216.1 hypothetical protein PX52LOC_03156 [Limnoglobus roseus]
MKLTVTARPLDPTEVVVEGDTEARPCGVCHLRLVVPTTALGQMVACPQCGTLNRALSSGGPFAELTTTPPPTNRPTPLPLDPNAPPILAPVMPYRPLDPIDERSPMVDAVANLQWISGAFLCVVAVYQFGNYWKREYSAAADDATVIASVVLRVLLAGVLALNSGGVNARRGAARVVAMAASAVVIGWVGWLLYERLNLREGQAGWFDFTILAEMPSLLIAIMTVVLLLTPRYRAEFRMNPLAQAGTM